MDAGGRRHVLVDHPVDAPRGLRDVEAEGTGDVLVDRPARGVAVEPHASTQEELGIEIAEQQVGVGHRW